MLANTKRVVERARAAGATVMHAPITFAEGDNALRYDYPMFSQPMTSAEFIEAVG
jgi:nicotinamidase-related amidase